MPKAYFSTVLDHPADAIWSVIRPFDHYGWAGVPSDTVMEGGRAGEQVGSVRRITAGGNVLRQVLLAHSDIDRSYSYAFASPPPFPAQNYLATIRVTPVVDSGQAFVEWSASFDCDSGDQERMTDQFETKGFAVWLAGLRAFMASRI